VVPDKSIAIVGSESLMARELREVLAETPFRNFIRLIGSENEAAVIGDGGDEAVVITPLEEVNLLDAHAAMLAGGADAALKALGIISGLEAPPAIIDLSFALEDRPTARLRAPMVEPKGFTVPAGTIHIIAQPAAIALTLFLNRLHAAFPIRHAVVQILEPASERGHKGIQELQKQTVSLLAFKKLPQDVYDAQVSFNLLPRYGTEAKEPLESFESRIERHLATLLSNSGKTPMPSLRLIQAPVFHGYSMSAWVEFKAAANPVAIGEAIAGAQIEVRASDEEPPSNVGVTGQSGIAITVEADRNNGRACWFWIVADNLRVSADNAVLVARELLEAGA
jgi:aspartate-semialdehyde dehydrogenase